MDYTTEFDEKKEICTIRVTGQHKRPEDSLALQQVARNLGDELDCQLFLFDMRQAEIVGSIVDTFEVGTVPADSDHRQLKQRIALVYAGNLSDHKFLETVALNRGYQVRVFDDIEEAYSWLKPNNRNS